MALGGRRQVQRAQVERKPGALEELARPVQVDGALRAGKAGLQALTSCLGQSHPQLSKEDDVIGLYKHVLLNCLHGDRNLSQQSWGFFFLFRFFKEASQIQQR